LSTEHDPNGDRPGSGAHASDPADVASGFDVDPERGLSAAEADRRREEHGPNQLREARKRSVWSILLDQYKSVVILVLVGAMVLALVFREWAETIAIAAIIVINTAIGFFTEWRAFRSMEALRQLGKHDTRVRRDGETVEIPASEIVPGDVLTLEAESLVPADARLVSVDGARVNEAALTGESAPVDKRTEAVEADTPLADRVNMIYKGSTLVSGSCEAVVVATGMDTELGHISEMAEKAEGSVAPLQKRLDGLGKRLAVIVLGVTIVVAGIGLLTGRDTRLMIETAIALGVAAIPEGLPIVATIALAHGMWLMSKRNALINRLTAVETLGATRVVFTDKTGTLTENRMRAARLLTPEDDHEIGEEESEPPDDPIARRLLDVAALCNAASLGSPDDEDDSATGDPTELALLEAARRLHRDRDELLGDHELRREVSFNSDVMMMATYHEAEGGVLVAVKGAPTPVLEACDRVATRESDDRAGEEPLTDEARREWEERAERLASEGLRVLAIADKHVDSEDDEPYEGLRLLGLVGLLDPPRDEVREAITRCRAAGVKVVMVTGDQPETARAIAEAVGIVGDEEDSEAVVSHGRDLEHPDEAGDEARDRMLESVIFARVSPEQKLNLVGVYQDAGEIVAMTGDGVNDAPALKKADIGIAMGDRGVDAAKQVADMILIDDAFASIVAAIEQGRVIFANIRKSVIFMLCTNVAEVLAVAVAAVTKWPLPLHPLQILYLNVLTDVFPALALAVTKGEPGVMDEPPRPADEPVLTRGHWIRLLVYGVIVAGVVLAGLLIALYMLDFEDDAAVTVSFMTLGFAKLWFAFNLRGTRSAFWTSPVVRNPWLWGAIAFCAGLLVAAVYAPGLSGLLEAEGIGWSGWSLVLALSVVPFVIGQIELIIRRARESRDAPENGRAPTTDGG